MNLASQTLNENDALPSQLDRRKRPPSTSLFLPTDNDDNISANEEGDQTRRIEEGATSDETDETDERDSQTLPLLANDLDRCSAAPTAPRKYRVRKNDIEGSGGNEDPIVIDECPICHEEHEVGDRVCHSSNPECRHVYHERCIVAWLVTLGWTRSKGRSAPGRLSKARGGRAEGRELLDYDLECPCCRRDFVDGPSLLGGPEGENEV